MEDDDFLPTTIDCGGVDSLMKNNIDFDLGFVRNDYGSRNDYSGGKHNNTCFFNSLMGALKRNNIDTNFQELLLIGSGKLYDDYGNLTKVRDGWDIGNILGQLIDTGNEEHIKGIQNIVDYLQIILCMWMDNRDKLNRVVKSTFVSNLGGRCFKGSTIDPCNSKVINLISDYSHFQELLFISQLCWKKDEKDNIIKPNNFYQARLLYQTMVKITRGSNIYDARKKILESTFLGEDLLPWEKKVLQSGKAFNNDITSYISYLFDRDNRIVKWDNISVTTKENYFKTQGYVQNMNKGYT